MSAPKAGGEGGEGGVYSCPFDVQGTCQFQELFQNKEGEDVLTQRMLYVLKHMLCRARDMDQ